MKSQQAYVEHVLACIRRVREDSAHGREAVFASRTLQDAILRNLQIPCESTQRLDERFKREHTDIIWQSISGMRNVADRPTGSCATGTNNAVDPGPSALSKIDPVALAKTDPP